MRLEESVQTKASAAQVWHAWEQGMTHQGGELKKGYRGKSKGRFAYQILEVFPYQSYLIVWKSFWIKVFFSQSVKSKGRGACITYTVEMKGWLGRLAKPFLSKKMHESLRLGIKDFADQMDRICS